MFISSRGFGTCCEIVINECGSTVTDNCTYIQNKGYPSKSSEAQASCVFNIKRLNENICFIRLDFNKFEMAPPEAISDTTNGECVVDSVKFT